MSAHTPGPWRMTKIGPRPVLVNALGGRISYVDDDMKDANARLIAAAPDLLVALQAYVNGFVGLGEARELALVAIAKATGAQ